MNGAVVPPLLHIPVPIELPPLVVEAVRHLVADHNANPPVVEGLGEVLGVEVGLQDAGREHCGGFADYMGCFVMFYCWLGTLWGFCGL